MLHARRLAALLCAALTIAMAGPATPAHAARVVLDTFGSDPSIAVDGSGTGHAAWYTQKGAAFPYDHFVRYCRIPAGGASCNTQLDLPTPGNAPQFNRTQVVVDGAKVHLLASLVDGIWAWTSTNGGDSFGPAPVQLNQGLDLDQAILGPGGFSIFMTGEVPTRFSAGTLDGTTKTTGAISLGAGLGPDPDGAYAYGGVGVLNSSTPFVVVNDADRTWLRRFNPEKTGYNVLGNWLPAEPIGSEEWKQDVASGPSGAFVSSEPKTGNALGDGLLIRRIADDGVVGAPKNIAAGMPNGEIAAVESDIAQDASGRVHAVYQDNRHNNVLLYQWSKRGETWGIPETLDADGDTSGYGTQVGVGADGAGWAMQDLVSGAYGQIRLYPLAPKGDSDPPQPPAPPAPPGPPGAPGPPPVVPPACPLKIAASPAAPAMVRSGPCFTDLGGGRYRTTGNVRLAGIDLIASAGGSITIDTKAHTVVTKGRYEARAGAIILRRDTIDWDLDDEISIDGLSAFGVSLLGFKLVGSADLSFAGGESRIGINLDLPYPLDGVRGRSTLRATMADGLRLDGVHITATSIPIGPIELRDLDIAFVGGTDRFEGKVKVFLPPGASAAVEAAFGMEGGQFKHAELELGAGVPPLPLPLWPAPPITLNRVGLALSTVDGFRLAGGVQLVAGGSIAGRSLLAINALPSAGGGATFFVPKSGKYAELTASGTLDLIDVPLANGRFGVRTDGPITFSGGASIDFDVIAISIKASGGINLSNGDFYGAGEGEACANFVAATGCATAKAIISSLGLAACGGLKITENLTGSSHNVDLGYARPWGGKRALGSCEFEKYKPTSLTGSGARARRLQAGGQVLTLGAGAQRGVVVKGAGGRPGFTFAGPGGRTITVAPGASEPTAASKIAAVPIGPDAVELQVAAPKGSWTLTPAAGSTITQVLSAAERPEPKVRGRVRSLGGRTREVAVTASNLGDQRLMVRELLQDGTAHDLGTVRGSGTTRLRFTPTSGPGGRRAIEAVVVSGSRQVQAIPVATYAAPAPVRLAAPRRVSLTRTKSAVAVRWTKVAGAARYRVRVKADDGRLQILAAPKSATRIAVPEVTGDDRVAITVAAIDARGAEGKPKGATSKPRKVAKKPARKKKPTTKKR